MRNEKTEKKLVSGINCREDNPLADMMLTKKFWNKTGGRQYKHFVLAFPPDENISYEEAHKIAVEFVENTEKLKGFEVCIVTHKDKDHIHSHIVVNSVNSEDGHKFRYSKHELRGFKENANRVLNKYGKSVINIDGVDKSKSDVITTDTLGGYKALQKAAEGNYKSFMLNIAVAVQLALNTAVSKEDFINLLNSQNITVNWSENRKNITFVDKEGHRVRNSALSKVFKLNLDKEHLLTVFNENSIRKGGTKNYEIPGHKQDQGTVDRGNGTAAADDFRKGQFNRGAARRAVRNRRIAREAQRRERFEPRQDYAVRCSDDKIPEFVGQSERADERTEQKRKRTHQPER